MKKKFLLLFFVLLGTSAWAGVKMTYVVTQTNGTLYYLDSPGIYSNWTGGFGCKYVSSDEILTFSPQDNTVNWGFTANSGFRINHQGSPKNSGTHIDANAIVSYTLTVPDNYTIVSYTFGAAPNGANSNAMYISTNTEMTDAVTVQKGSDVTERTETVDAQSATFYLQHKNGATPIDVTLSVVVEAPVTPKEAIKAYLTEDKMANIGHAGQYGYPKTTSLSYINLKSIVDRLDSDADEAFTSSDFDNVQAYYDAYIAETDIVVPESGKFYRIYAVNAAGNKYLTSSDAKKIIGIRTANPEGASFVWYFGEDNTLAALSNGYLFDSINTLSCAGTAIAFERSPSVFGKVCIASGGQRWFVQASVPENSDLIADTSNGGYGGAQFFVEEVTTLPITISSVGYAPLYSPVALTIPADVKAYTGRLNDAKDALILVAVENGVIPAETAVVLEANEGEYDFVVTPNTETIADNFLKGSTGLADASGILTLQVIEDKLGFYTYTNEGGLPAFKAYIDATELSAGAAASNALSIIFDDGDITAIEGVEVANGDAGVYFDLQGRRVVAPQKGQLYIVNGKKVLLK